TTTYPSLYKTPLRVAPYFYGVPKKVSPFVYPYRLPKKTPYVPPYVSPKRVLGFPPYKPPKKEEAIPYITTPTKGKPYAPITKPYKPAAPYKPPIVTPYSPVLTETIPPEIIPPIFRPRIKKKKRIVKEKDRGWDIYGKKVGSKRYIKSNVVPIKYKLARSLGAEDIDKSLSTNFYVKQTNKKAQKPVRKIQKDYFEKNIKKFRDYKFRTVKGIRKKFPMEKKIN
ncbi:unnamed protein product, partial [marine sediment metagenome]